MTFQQLSFAVEVAKCTSINKAAEQLYTHQSNVSTVLKQLETELGIQIFVRTKKGVTVTAAGREFLDYAEEIISKKEFVEDLYSVRNQYRRQYFSVSSMRAYFLSDPITRLQSHILSLSGESTYVRLKKCAFDDVLEDVDRGYSNIGIVFLLKSQKRNIKAKCNVKNLTYVELGESRMHVVLRENHPVLAHADVLNHITEYPYAISEDKEKFDRFYDESSHSILQLFQTPPKCFISSNDSVITQDIVANSDAFFISSTPWQHSENYHFSSIPLNGEDNVLSYFYVVRKNQEHTPLTAQYIQALRTLFSTLPN